MSLCGSSIASLKRNVPGTRGLRLYRLQGGGRSFVNIVVRNANVFVEFLAIGFVRSLFFICSLLFWIWEICRSLVVSEIGSFRSLVFNKVFNEIHDIRSLIGINGKRRYADNADILSVMRSAEHIISRFTLEHVRSHQDDKTDFVDLPFDAQLNVLCDRMATDQMQRQGGNPWEATQPCPLPPRHLLVEVTYGDHHLLALRQALARRNLHRQTAHLPAIEV